MKKFILSYIVSFFTSVLLVFALQGCSDELADPNSSQEAGENEGVIMITTRAADSSNPEEAIRCLRLLIFSVDNNKNSQLILNKRYLSSDAGSTTPSGFQRFFIKETDVEGNQSYTISEIIEKSTIKIMLVANELTDMSEVATESDVKNTLLNFYKVYNTESGTMDINIDNSGSVENANKGYIPMFVETEAISPNSWNASNGRVIRLAPQRTLAKVTFQIGAVSGTVGLGGGSLSINSASIVRSSQSVLLGDSMVSNMLPLVSTVTKTFGQPIVIDGKNQPVLPSGALTFYIPENIVPQDNADKGLYTYIQVNAIYTPPGSESGGTTDVNTVYKIPIGNGVARMYENLGTDTPATEEDFNKLTASDMKISRNKHYNVIATVNSVGTLQIMKIKVDIQDWTEVGVTGDIDKPCLNLSAIDYDYHDGAINRIYFWSNIDKAKIALKNTVDVYHADGSIIQTKEDIDNVFKNLKFEGSTAPTNFHSLEGTSLDFPSNGYFDMEITEGFGRDEEKVVKLYFIAGMLQREVTVRVPKK